MMQTLNILILCTLALSCLVSAAPKPQGNQSIQSNILQIFISLQILSFTELADSSEVELINPFDSSAPSDGQGKPVVVVVRPTSFGEVFAGFPGFGRFPGFNSFPRFGEGQHPHIGLDEIFGGDQEEPLTPSSGTNCGLLCKVSYQDTG